MRREQAADRWAVRYRMLTETLIRCGLDLSDDDEAAVEFIARWEPRTVRTIASWVLRARSASRDLTAGVNLPDVPDG